MYIKTLNLYVEKNSSGRDVFEEVPVLELGNYCFKILASPGLVLNLAKNDIIEILEYGRFYVLQRGGNVCVQLFFSPEMNENIEKFIYIVNNKLNGSLDGKTNKLAAFSIPVSIGFENIEPTFNKFISDNPGSEWYYGNVYDPDDGVTPINWWVEKYIS